VTRLALTLALQGSLADEMAAQEARLTFAIELAADVTGEQVRDWIRRDVRAAGLGEKLPKTWTYEVYPERGGSLAPAIQIYTRAPHIFEGLVRGTEIVPKGQFLAIPTENAPRKIFNKRPTPALYERRFGPGRLWLFRRRNFALLVDRDVRRRKGASGGFAPRTATSKGVPETAVMFVLVPRVNPRRRLNLADYEARGAALFAEVATRQVARELADEFQSQRDFETVSALRRAGRRPRRGRRRTR